MRALLFSQIKIDKPVWTFIFLVAAAGCGDDSRVIDAISVDESVILSSQIGYHRYGDKKALLRVVGDADLSKSESFEVVDSSGNTAYSGAIVYAGSRWGSSWWEMEFSDLTDMGTYWLTSSLGHESEQFRISDTPLLDADLFRIAVSQLDERYPAPNETGSGVDPRTGYDGTYIVPEGNDVALIYRDAGSNYAEIPSVGITIHGLVDLYDRHRERYSADEVSALLANIERGADYLVSAQERHHTGATAALKNGRFFHSPLVNRHMSNGDHSFAGQVFVWNDTAYAIGVLARASHAIRSTDPKKAQRYLDAAELAWQNALTRPYYLPEELDISNIPNYDASIGAWPWNDWEAEARAMYAIDDASWSFSDRLASTAGFDGLRTRELLTMLWSSTLIYRYSNDPAEARSKYLDVAVRVAREVADRQYLNHEASVDGIYGMFREFSQRAPAADSNAILMESAQTGFVHMGNFTFPTISGFIELQSLLPDHEDAATWSRAVKTWGEHYAKKAAAMSPLGIHPSTVYLDSTTGDGVYFFGNRLHGANELYGQAARTLIEVAEYTQDPSYAQLATNNLQMYAGLNPGIPIDGLLKSSTLIKGVGSVSVASMESSAPNGSMSTGYNSTAGDHEFYTADEMPADAPAHFTAESWIAISHAYVMGVALVEDNHTLTVSVSNSCEQHAAQVKIEFENSNISPRIVNLVSGDSPATISDLPTNQRASVKFIRDGEQDLVEPLVTTAGATSTVELDCADRIHVEVVRVPKRVQTGERFEVDLLFSNRNPQIQDVTVYFSCAGCQVERREEKVSIEPGQQHRLTVAAKAQSNAEPYLLRGMYETPSQSGSFDTSGLVYSSN